MTELKAGYCRVSTVDQDLTAQQNALAALGVDPKRIYLDHGLTGTNRNRPGLRQAMAACRQGDQTRSLLLLSDGAYLEDQARALNLGGTQWGMMNETGNYPGQPWMWLYTFWYQVPPFSTSDNADAQVWALMMLLSLALLLVPFIPGLRSLPRLIPIHRLVWRDYYRDHPRT